MSTPTTTPARPATVRRRAYIPRISNKGKSKDALVSQKEAELRDARILNKLIAQIKELTPWGLGKLEEMRSLMKSGDVHRNHNRVGKCAGCSRRDNCPERLL